MLAIRARVAPLAAGFRCLALYPLCPHSIAADPMQSARGRTTLPQSHLAACMAQQTLCKNTIRTGPHTEHVAALCNCWGNHSERREGAETYFHRSFEPQRGSDGSQEPACRACTLQNAPPQRLLFPQPGVRALIVSPDMAWRVQKRGCRLEAQPLLEDSLCVER